MDSPRKPIDDILGDFQGWLYKTAGHILQPSSPDLDDLVQEGRLAMWLALDSYDPDKGSLTHWLTSKARYRMLEVAGGKKWTGQPPRLHGRNSAREPVMLSLDAGHGDGVTLAETVPAPDMLDGVELAYHHAEIEAARARLTPAQQLYVQARFWQDMTGTEMIEADVFGYDPSALWNSAKNGAKYKLRVALAHMSEVAA